MRAPWGQRFIASGCAAAALLLQGCAEQSIKPAEVLDERTGMTVGALEQPIEYVETLPLNAAVSGKHASFAYLGPVEWDQMGHIIYGLWLHVAPGNDRQMADLRRPQTASLLLDQEPVTLSYIDPPQPGRAPYRSVASWGQSAYFELTEDLIKRIATCRTLELRIRAADDSTAVFLTTDDARGSFERFARSRGITVD